MKAAAENGRNRAARRLALARPALARGAALFFLRLWVPARPAALNTPAALAAGAAPPAGGGLRAGTPGKAEARPRGNAAPEDRENVLRLLVGEPASAAWGRSQANRPESGPRRTGGRETAGSPPLQGPSPGTAPAAYAWGRGALAPALGGRGRNEPGQGTTASLPRPAGQGGRGLWQARFLPELQAAAAQAAKRAPLSPAAGASRRAAPGTGRSALPREAWREEPLDAGAAERLLEAASLPAAGEAGRPRLYLEREASPSGGPGEEDVLALWARRFAEGLAGAPEGVWD